ncbi:hypothetical protein OSTOST_10006 [Ostertagia ostertagi]
MPSLDPLYDYNECVYHPTGYPRPHFDTSVEYSLDKRKRWEEIREIQEDLERNTTQAVVNLCTPFRGSIWWYMFSGAVDLAKLSRRILCEAAVKGKSKNMTLVSQVSSPELEEPIFKFSIVRCYSDSTYHSQLLKYRRHLDRTKRRSTSKIHRKFSYDEDDL